MIRVSSVLLIVLLFFSCGKRKELIPTVQVKNLTALQVIQKLKANERHYDWLQLNGKIKFNTEENKFSGGLLVRTKKDSIVWGRIKKLGIEGARIFSDQNGFTVLNRIDKTVAGAQYDQIEEQTGSLFGLSELGGILSAGAYLPEDVVFTSVIDSQAYVLSARYEGRDIIHRVRAYDFQLASSEIYDAEGRGIQAEYSEYEYSADSLSQWPMKRLYTIRDGKTETRIELNIKDVEQDGPYNMPFSIPPHYERIQ